MKKYLSAFVLIICMMMCVTSCKEDQKLAFKLSGYWQGNLGMSYRDMNRVIWHSNDTEIYFNCFFETKGDGFQIDYYTGGDYPVVFHRFEWDITNGVISIKYNDDRMEGFNTEISNYTLDNYIFVGEFGGTDNWFELSKKNTFPWVEEMRRHAKLTEYLTREKAVAYGILSDL